MFSMYSIDEVQQALTVALMYGEFRWSGDDLVVMLDECRDFRVTVEGVRKGEVALKRRLGERMWNRAMCLTQESTAILACAVAGSGNVTAAHNFLTVE